VTSPNGLALWARSRQAIARLYPGYFALVMATGVVSVAAHRMGITWLARPLLWLNVAAYGVLMVMTVLRVAVHFRRVVGDLTDHARGPAFFTIVAATCLVGSQIVTLTGDLYAAAILGSVGVALWFLLTYSFLTVITVREDKPDLAHGINGTWLIAVVATQSVSILGTLTAGILAPWDEVVLLFGAAMYLFGCVLYMLTITLVFYRMTFFKLDPESLSPTYWINMGAVATTTLAGVTLLRQGPHVGILVELAPFSTGLTALFWVTATGWVPFLLLLGAWRHVYRGVPFRYEPQYWGMVFALGVYSVCTFDLAEVMQLPLLLPIARAFGYVALLSWLITLAGLTHALFAPAPMLERRGEGITLGGEG
jgi:tellurite resistance protein TehA-like permease